MPIRKTIIVAIFSFLTVQSCYAADREISMYVLVPPGKATVFTQELASLLKQLGLEAQLGDITMTGVTPFTLLKPWIGG